MNKKNNSTLSNNSVAKRVVKDGYSAKEDIPAPKKLKLSKNGNIKVIIQSQKSSKNN